MDEPGTDSDVTREQILAAALDEVTDWGIERFSVENLLARSGIDRTAIAAHWLDDEELLLDVLLDWPGRTVGPPDTGSLAGDLAILVMAMAAYIDSQPGRRIQRALVIPNHSGMRIDIRQKVWLRRASMMQGVFARAVARNEMRPDLDSRIVLQMLMAPINMRLLLTYEPVDEEYRRTLVDMVCRAVAPDN
ncbi:TetR family transcriptional regulator [Mycobacterium sp. CBMA293]|uniref:TetR-like C-terminal domain-containing protein n=1 Tax=unclassified Mycolicibacterium TaxID=2636767 RepID=UPI0012DF4965|nr:MULTISPECIES: TetR-like C-terminal domain-containing protein [unclassified Mycolicibacterium]MUL48283.1 TetR family transcriptional regulator [Mycolicibacterium sp. CBMA 360]MUL92638.1 TetR family transcriptional regulator [Mycolicibacterium sp. CBMA 230]MUM32039.1 TetR family transcriptional regulator [Mycolicibacterium sp. CBMA 361]MUL57550.1 TetR family transcriptional regulator [Mycolicibacterium sp. CBMA 335]MUL70590.1 TetR family transcriptional regulator [Mycolicibacterium sp. CBMA 3